MSNNPNINIFLDPNYKSSFTALNESFEDLSQTDNSLEPNSRNNLQNIVILDFGSQYSELIARRVRELKVYSEVLPHNISVEKLRLLCPQGIILSGGPASVYEKGSPDIDPEIFELGIPILGICYGMQIAVLTMGGKVAPIHLGGGEYGKDKLLNDIKQ